MEWKVGWTKSSVSMASGGNCVEVECQDGAVYVRDSKLGEGSPVLGFTPAGWRSFMGVAQGWDRKSHILIAGMLLEAVGGDFPVRVTSAEGILRFTWAEWDAFVQGVEAGEFEVGKSPGRVAYEAYRESRRYHEGAVVEQWDALPSGQQQHWHAVAAAVLRCPAASG